MKKLLLAFICLVISSNVLQSQEVCDVFKSKKATWYGLDFSKVRLIGSEGFQNPQNIKNSFFASWNDLILYESEKYDLEKIFRKDEVNIDLSIVKERNKLPDANKLIINDEDYALDKAIIEEVIRKYNSNEGIGIVFIMESFNKLGNLGTMWVTFFDGASKTVLLTEKMSGKTGGIGLRNFWARTYYNVFVQIEKKEYLKWEKEYCK